MNLFNKLSFFTAIFISTASIAMTSSEIDSPLIDPTQLRYMPTEAPDNHSITTIRKKLDGHSTPEKTASLCPAIDIIKIEKPGQRKGVCYRVAMKKSLKLTKKEIDSLPMLGCDDWTDKELNIFNDYYEQTDIPTAGTLAVYLDSKKNYSIPHFGIVQSNGKIRSKFAVSRGIYDHPLWYLPNNWGDCVVFYNLKNRWLNKENLLIDLKKKLYNAPHIQATLENIQDNFFHYCHYAHANNSLTYPPITTPGFFIYARLKQCPNINIDMRDKKLLTPLMLASERGSLNIALVLVDNNADLNLQNDKGETALHLAAKNNHCNVVIFLLNRGANPDIPDNKGNKPAIPFYATYHTPLIYGTTAMIGSLLAYAAYKTTTD